VSHSNSSTLFFVAHGLVQVPMGVHPIGHAALTYAFEYSQQSDNTYECALEAIPKEQQQHAHRLSQCQVAAIRPLRVEELAKIFAIDFDTDTAPNLMMGWRPENPEDALLSACSTLIVIAEDQGSKIVQFSHFSLKGFLTSDRLWTSYVGSIRRYHILLDSAHTILGRASHSAAAIGQKCG
jgi:hypothetical protein